MPGHPAVARQDS